MDPAEDPQQFHFTPDTYAEMIRSDVPRYEELQERTIGAIPFARDFCASRNNRKNHSGASAIGAVFFQPYRSPLA